MSFYAVYKADWRDSKKLTSCFIITEVNIQFSILVLRLEHTAYLDHNESATGCALHGLCTETTVFGLAQSVHIK